jgi:hypothetical protein
LSVGRRFSPRSYVLRHWQAGEIEEGWRDVHQFDQCVADKPRPAARRAAEDQRHAHQALVKAAALLDQAVVAERLAMVSGEDHHRVVAAAGGFDRCEHACEVVDKFDHSVVGSPQRLPQT